MDNARTDSFMYTVADRYGGGHTTKVTIKVNSIPVGGENSYNTFSDETLLVEAFPDVILKNIKDSDGDSLIIVIHMNPANGNLILNEDGSFVYVPGGVFLGVGSFTCTISDGNIGMQVFPVYNNVVKGSEPPVAVEDMYLTQDKTDILVQTVKGILGNYWNLNKDTLTIRSYTQTLNVSTIVEDDGSFLYKPNTYFTSIDSLKYTVFVVNGGTNTAIDYIKVNKKPDESYNSHILPKVVTLGIPAPILLVNDMDL